MAFRTSSPKHRTSLLSATQQLLRPTVLPRASVASAALATAGAVAVGHLTAFVSTSPGSGPQSRGLRTGEAGSSPPAAGHAAAARAAGVLGAEPLSACAAVGLVAGVALAAVRTSRAARPERVLARRPDRRLVSLWAFEGELGVQAPVGFWDPLGLAKDGNVAAFKRRRAVELKHGRLSMLATMGYLTPEITGKFPGYLSKSMDLKFADVPNGLGAFTKVPALGWVQIIAYCFLCEVSGLSEDYENGTPGDYGWKVLTSEDPEIKTRKLNAELANGRLAMVAIMGMLFQNGTVGTTDAEMWLGGGAFEGELGVQAPVGFWDPLGLSKDGDAAAFTRRRVTEIKHGRVSMFACLGYIVPEYVKWPGYCAPSERLAFADIPNGLGALSKVPGGGWLQIALFCGVVEKGLFVYDPSRAPGDYENAGVLGVPNGSTLPAGETKTRKLNAEIANGRLAMMAIIGMLFQDGLTGSAWGDWAMYTDSPLRATEDSGTGDVPDATEDSGTGDVPDGATEDSGTRDVPDGAAHAAGAVAFNPASQIGAMAPLGFWDPLGFCKDKDENNFLKLRGIELKHGRVAMLSIFGFWAEHAWRVPGFRDVPSGVYALTTFPGSVGFAFAVLLVGILELGPLPDLEKGNPPGNFGDPARLIDEEDWPIGTYDDQWRNFEINHCRLAMFGAIGAIAASLNTGKDAVEQWQTAKPAVIEFIKTTIWWAP